MIGTWISHWPRGSQVSLSNWSWIFLKPISALFWSLFSAITFGHLTCLNLAWSCPIATCIKAMGVDAWITFMTIGFEDPGNLSSIVELHILIKPAWYTLLCWLSQCLIQNVRCFRQSPTHFVSGNVELEDCRLARCLWVTEREALQKLGRHAFTSYPLSGPLISFSGNEIKYVRLAKPYFWFPSGLFSNRHTGFTPRIILPRSQNATMKVSENVHSIGLPSVNRRIRPRPECAAR